jgi:hypothetical protein
VYFHEVFVNFDYDSRLKLSSSQIFFWSIKRVWGDISVSRRGKTTNKIEWDETLFSNFLPHCLHKNNFLAIYSELSCLLTNYHLEASRSRCDISLKLVHTNTFWRWRKAKAAEKGRSTRNVHKFNIQNSFLWSFYTVFIFLIHFNVHEAQRRRVREIRKPWIWIKQKKRGRKYIITKLSNGSNIASKQQQRTIKWGIIVVVVTSFAVFLCIDWVCEWDGLFCGEIEHLGRWEA